MTQEDILNRLKVIRKEAQDLYKQVQDLERARLLALSEALASGSEELIHAAVLFGETCVYQASQRADRAQALGDEAEALAQVSISMAAGMECPDWNSILNKK